MKITCIYGSETKGSTYNIARLFIKKLCGEDGSVTEFFLPKDMSEFCKGCCNCFSYGESLCPHSKQIEPIQRAMIDADLLIFTSPVYALRVSGQMKTLLDHFAFLFMTHRPDPSMFSKTALVLSTGAGGGTKATMKDIATSLRFWGVAKIYKYGTAVYNSSWEAVDDKIKQKVYKKVDSISSKISKKHGNVRPGIVTKLLFNAFRMFHSKFGFCPYDVEYWEKNGWLKKKRPWQITDIR